MHIFLVSVGFIWLFILFWDTIFKTCMFHPYYRALQFSGLSVKPFIIYMRITRFNRFINRMGQWRSSALRIWFDAGAIVTCIIAVPCLMTYLVSLYQMYKISNAEDFDNSVLLPIIPGYNFPLSHWMYFVIIVLLCSIFHEFGHALAASRERISIEDFGFAVCAVFSLAFVNVRFEQFRQISKWQQLRILCAGIWHNIVLTLLALFFWFFLTTPISPLYTIGNGVTVHGVYQHLELNHPAGFTIGDNIHHVGDCNIELADHWRMCLQTISNSPQPGLCVPENTYSKSLQTCPNSSDYQDYLHFQTAEKRGDICLHARQATKNFNACNQTSTCPMSSSCLFPSLPTEMHRFVTIKRHKKPSVLYFGTMDDLFTNVQVSRFIQKYKYFPVSYAEYASTLLQYIIVFSSGLACMNMLPILSLDGQFIIEILVHICLEKFIPRFEQRRNIFIWIQRIALNVAICLGLLMGYKFYTIIN